jgi:glycosyltransferase involved in cell wall biosynthesis
MKRLSIIIPYVNEYPNIAFTVQNLIEETRGLDAEIITVANQSKQTHDIKGGETIPDYGFWKLQQSPFVREGVLKNIRFDDKLSHWNAKNAGIKEAQGERVMFIDAHCIVESGAIKRMLDTPIEGTLNMNVCYLLDSRKLNYKTRESDMGYVFTIAPTGQTEPYQVPVMSTCGMMVEKKLFDEIGAWNPELGIYGGGENYMMYKIGTCGYPIKVHPKATLYHFSGDYTKRGYSWNYDDHMRNQFIAAYCVGDEEWLQKLVDERCLKPHSNKDKVHAIADDVRIKCKGDREFIKTKQKISISDYFKKWGSWDRAHMQA